MWMLLSGLTMTIRKFCLLKLTCANIPLLRILGNCDTFVGLSYLILLVFSYLNGNVLDLLLKTGMLGTKQANYPIDPNVNWDYDKSPNFPDDKQYL